MLHEDLPIGSSAPHAVNTIVEVPKGHSNKYKYAAEHDIYKFDRTLFSPLYYPYDYGWICGTKQDAETPVNMLVMSSNPTFPGCMVVARPIGALLMNDHRGEDHKILSVAVVDPRFDHVRSLGDIPEHTLLEVRHFFEIYQVLEHREVEILGWEDADATRERLMQYVPKPVR